MLLAMNAASDLIWNCVVCVWGFVEGFRFLVVCLEMVCGGFVVSVLSGAFFLGSVVQNWVGY